MERLKCCTYNIESGGFASYSMDLLAPERLSLVKEVLTDINADVVGIIDAYRFNDQVVFSNNEAIALFFGYPYAYAYPLEDSRLKEGNNICVTLLSKYACETSPIRIHNRNALKSIIRTPSSEIDVFTVYLDDVSEETRLQEITELLEYHVDEKRRTLIMGDYNAISHGDTTGTKIRFGKMFQSFALQKYGLLYSVGEKLADHRVIPYLEQHGFIDVAKASKQAKPTIPTKKVNKHLFPVLRLDYAFVHGLIPVSAEVIRNEKTNRASDHYPLVFTVDFEDN